MDTKIVLILFMIILGIATSQYIIVGLASITIRMRNLQRTIATTGEIPFINKDLLTPDRLRSSMTRRRTQLFTRLILGNIVWILFILACCPSPITMKTMTLLVGSYLVFGVLVSLVVFYTVSIYGVDQRRLYIYTAFLPSTI